MLSRTLSVARSVVQGATRRNYWGLDPNNILHRELAAELQRMGLDLRYVTDVQRWTPLIIAAKLNKPTLVARVCGSTPSNEMAGTINRVSKRGETALDIAESFRNNNIVKILEKFGAAPVGNSTTRAFLKDLRKKNGFSLVYSIINNNKTLVNSANEHGTTLLHLSCQYGELALVQDLLLKGADSGAKDNDGNNSALHLAKNMKMQRRSINDSGSYVPLLQLVAYMDEHELDSVNKSGESICSVLSLTHKQMSKLLSEARKLRLDLHQHTDLTEAALEKLRFNPAELLGR